MSFSLANIRTPRVSTPDPDCQIPGDGSLPKPEGTLRHWQRFGRLTILVAMAEARKARQ